MDFNLVPTEKDVLGEIGNISFGTAATALSTMLVQKVDITTPSVDLIEKSLLIDKIPAEYVLVEVEYVEGIDGVNVFIIKLTDAAIIADLMMGGNGQNPSTEIGDIELSAIQEAMNMMMGSSATSMSSIFGKRVDISPPKIKKFDEVGTEMNEWFAVNQKLVSVSLQLTIGTLIDSEIMQLMPIDIAKKLVKNLMEP